MEAAPTTIRAERDEKHPLAIILGKGVLATTLVGLLKEVHLRTLLLEHSLDRWHILEQPHYCYLLVTHKDNLDAVVKLWQEALPLAKRSGAKVIFIEAGLSRDQEERLLKVATKEKVELLTLVLAGEVESVLHSPTSFLRECISAGYGHPRQGRKVIVARGGSIQRGGGSKEQTERWEAFLRSQGLRNTEEVLSALKRSQGVAEAGHHKLKQALWAKRRFALGLRAVLLMIAFFFLMPLLVSLLAFGGGVGYLLQARVSLERGEFLQASQQAGEAERTFERGKFVMREISALLPVGQGVFAQLLEVGESGSQVAGVVKRGAILQKSITSLAQDIFSGEKKADLPARVATLHPELLALNQELGMVQTMLSDDQIQTFAHVSGWFGFPLESLKRAPGEIARGRELLISADRILTVLPELLAISPQTPTKSARQTRTYLLIFQNSAELRPTGGFIGSFAVLTMEEGIMKDLVFHDVYSADGQLQGRVIPPDEIVHFLGQNSWYLRDANFSPDFPLTAKRLEFFLEKETGQQVDGVIGIDLQAVQYLLSATGPLTLADFGEEVTAENFFQKAEFASEINFFPGSTKKRDYLGAVGQTLLQTLLHGKNPHTIAVAQALERGLREQHIMLFFNNRTAQERVEANNWSGSITRHSCGTAVSQCLMLVDSNFGANKANYFLKRAVRVNTKIGEQGELETKVVVHFRNDSPSLAWPAGNYKNYVRFLLPQKAKLMKVEVDNGKSASISSVLNASVLSKITPEQFLVHTTKEASGALALSTTEAYLSVGTLVEVPLQSDREVSLTYRWSLPVSSRKTLVPFRFVVLKQGGTGADPLDVSIEFPQSWKKVSGEGRVSVQSGISAGALVFPQRVLYNTDLASDRVFEMEFQR